MVRVQSAWTSRALLAPQEGSKPKGTVNANRTTALGNILDPSSDRGQQPICVAARVERIAIALEQDGPFVDAVGAVDVAGCENVKVVVLSPGVLPIVVILESFDHAARIRIESLLRGAGFGDIRIDRDRGGRFWLWIRAVRAHTLPDYVRPGLDLLFCGLNPSLLAAETGVPYGRPGNRFWPAAKRARLCSRDRDPWHALACGVGFTDLVKRPTRAAREHQRERRPGDHEPAGALERPARARLQRESRRRALPRSRTPGGGRAKRLLIHSAAFNLSLLLRREFGFGTPRALRGLLFMLERLLGAILRLLWRSKHPYSRLNVDLPQSKFGALSVSC